MSARIITKGPGPLFKRATRPVPPTFSLTLKPWARNSWAIFFAVLYSPVLSSGLA